MHFKCYYFPSFDLSFVFVRGAFIFGGVHAVWRGALEPASFHVSDANSQPDLHKWHSPGCRKAVTADCFTPLLAWAGQEPLLWCFVCTHAQIKATTLLINKKACGKINNLINREKMDVEISTLPWTLASVSEEIWCQFRCLTHVSGLISEC